MSTPNKRKSKEPKGVWLAESFYPQDSEWHVLFMVPQSSRRGAEVALQLAGLSTGGYRATRYIPALKTVTKKGAKKK